MAAPPIVKPEPTKLLPPQKRTIEPEPAHETEAERNARILTRTKKFDRDYNQAKRIQYERDINQPRTFLTNRKNLGLGTSVILPNDEVAFPYDVLASKIFDRMRGVVEGEAVELVPSTNADPKSIQAVHEPNRTFVYRRTPMAEDFVVPKGQYARFKIQQPRMVLL